MTKRIRGPSGRLISMAGRAGIRNLVFFRLGRRDECKRVRVHVDVGDGRLDCRHMAAHAFAARRARAMMRVFL